MSRLRLPLAFVVALGMALPGCVLDDLYGCWRHVNGDDEGFSITFHVTDEDGDGEVYEIEGRWAYTDDPDWRQQPGGVDAGTWPHVGHWSGTAIRDENGISIFGDLTDCDGNEVGTIQADDLWIVPGQWQPGFGRILKALRGDRVLAQTEAFTYEDTLSATQDRRQLCGADVFAWYCRLQ